jgi:hypothetical protein
MSYPLPLLDTPLRPDLGQLGLSEAGQRILLKEARRPS